MSNVTASTTGSFTTSCQRTTIDPKTAFVTYSGPSATGKNKAADTLQQEFPWMKMIRSKTTRRLREGQDLEYDHLSEDEFEKLSHDHRFLWTMSVFGNRYGTLGADIDNALRLHQESSLNACVMHVHHSKVELLQDYVRQHGDDQAVFSFLVICEDEDLIRRRMLRRDPGIAEPELNARIEDFQRSQRHYRDSGVYHALIVSRDDKDEGELLQEMLHHLAQPVPKPRRL